METQAPAYKRKIYYHVKFNDNLLPFFVSNTVVDKEWTLIHKTDKINIAGNPNFLAEWYKEVFWDKEGKKHYEAFLKVMKVLADATTEVKNFYWEKKKVPLGVLVKYVY